MNYFVFMKWITTIQETINREYITIRGRILSSVLQTEYCICVRTFVPFVEIKLEDFHHYHRKQSPRQALKACPASFSFFHSFFLSLSSHLCPFFILVNTLRPGQIYICREYIQMRFLEWKSLYFDPESLICNGSSIVQVMTWHLTWGKQLSVQTNVWRLMSSPGPNADPSITNHY